MSEAAITSTSTGSSALNRRDVTRDIFSASIGSVACCYTGQPFDTVKVRMQTNPSAFPSVAFTTRSILANEVSFRCSHYNLPKTKFRLRRSKKPITTTVQRERVLFGKGQYLLLWEW